MALRKRVTATRPRFSSMFIAARENSYISFGAIGLPPFMARISCSLVAGIGAPDFVSTTSANTPGPR